MLRRAAGLLMVGMLALTGLVSCARDEPLLVVNGWALSRGDFLAELDQVARNQDYLDARARTGQPLRVFKEGSTTEYAPEFVVEFLNERVTFQLAAAELVARKLTVTGEDHTRAIVTINEGLATTGSVAPSPSGSIAVPASGPGTTGRRSALDGFGSYREVLITGVASLQVLQRALSADITTDDQLRPLYEQLKDKYANQSCARHLLVRAGDGGLDQKTGATIVPTELEYATALSIIVPLRAELAGGADFATVAGANSQDPATKDRGGDLGCAPKGQYETAFDAAVWSQPVGTVGDPVKSAFGYHLVLVTERRTKSFDEVKDVLRQAVEAQGEQALQEWLSTHSRDATVIVDPGVGRWNASSGVIEAPEGSTKGTLVPDDQATVPPTAPGTTEARPLVPAGGS